MGATKNASAIIALLVLCGAVGSLPPAPEEAPFTVLNPVTFYTETPTLNEQESETSKMTSTNRAPIPTAWGGYTTYNAIVYTSTAPPSANQITSYDTTVERTTSAGSAKIIPYITDSENTAHEINSIYIPVQPGDRVVFGCWIKTSAVGEGYTFNDSWGHGARIGIDFYGAGQRITAKQDATTKFYPNVTDAENDAFYVDYNVDEWTFRKLEFTVPATLTADGYSGHEEGTPVVPSGFIAWMQVWDSNGADNSGGASAWFADAYIYINPVVASTELINYSNFTAGNIDTWISLLQEQGITEFTLRIPAYTDFTDGTLSSTYETVSLAIIADAYAAGIDVNIDLHTWHTTWDTYFEDAATNSSTYRSTYLSYITDCIGKLDVDGVTAFMVLNEPQAQTASTAENNFILSCISTAQAATAKPVSVRFMAGYSPSTGHYSSSIDTACDFLCRNTYWDARSPTTTVYGSTEAKLLTAIATAHVQGKELWITEFGKSKSNTEDQRAYVAAFLTWANSNGVDRAFCWASQPSAAGETYNIFSGFTPYPAFYELGGAVAATQTATPVFSPVAGTYGATQNVSITCSTSGAVIYYTTDGSTPDNTDTEYSEAVEVTENTTIKAVAVATGYTDSNVATAGYIINLPPTTPAPIIVKLILARMRD